MTGVRSVILFIVVSLLIGITGCSNASGGNKLKEDRLTVGKVQGEIKMGMSSAAVIEVLGSPNIISTDELRREVWVYDKISSDRVDTSNSTFATLFIIGTSSDSSSSSTRQKTLTIFIKFDEEKKVRDFAYNSSSF